MGHLPEADGAPVSSNIGAYKVLETLGAGGMGIVYLAEPLGGGTRVALKTVTSRSEAVLYGIRREVQALRALDHPGVVRVLDVGTHKGAPYYAMEALDGPTLRSYRRARARTPDPTRVDTADIEAVVPSSESRPASGSRAAAPDDLRAHALAVIRSVCETLAFVHGRGIVHRDLKPDNVILTEDRGPVLVDFGIAALALGSRTREVLETAGRTYGSPGYMAPEQIRGELVDARADLYAIGTMLFECVTGRLPFEGEAVRTLLSKKLHGEAPRASRYVPDLSLALDDLIARLLSRKKEDRPGHAIDVAAALADQGAGRIGPSGPPGEPYLYRPRISGRDDAMGRIDRAMSTATASRRVATPAGEIEVTSARARPTPTIVDRPLVSTHVRTSLPVEVDLTLDVTSAIEAPFSQGAVVLVGGESGVGKTRLVMEAALRGAQRGFKVVTGECVHVGSDEDAAHGLVGRALHPFRGFLQAVVDACSDASDLESLLGPHARLLAAFEPALATLEGFDAQPEPESVPPEAARARVNEAVFAVLAAFAQRTPTLLVLDDLQWADEPSLRLLESLERSRLRELPLVVLATYRADEAPPLLRAIASSPDVVDIRLSRLGSASLLAIVRDMLAIDEVDPELAAFIESESDGNPFFVAEWLRAAVERGLLVRDARGRFRLDLQSKHLLASIPAPRALGEIVETRLARLDADALSITRMSAVLGRDAAAGVLAAALGMPDVMGTGAVTELLRRDVFEEKDGTLRFVHDKLREAAYAAIPAADRPRMHRAAARALEHHAFSAGDEDRWTNELAHHWAEAGEAELALPLLDRAGELAARAGSYGDALRCFERALSLFTDAAPLEPSRRAERARWVRRAAEAHHATGDLRAAELRGREALRLATGGPTILDRSYESGRRARLAFVAAAGAAVVEQVRRASRPVVAPTPSAEHELHREAALAAEKLGQTYLFLNDSTRAGLATVLAGNHAAALGPSPELARASAQLAIAASYVPAHGYARRYVARAHEIASDLGEPDTQLMVSFMRGFWGLGASDGAEAMEHLREARRIAHERKDHRREEECLALIGLAETFRARHGDALDTYDELAALSERSQNLQSHIWATGGRGQVYARIGRATAAIEQFARIRSHVARTNDESEKVQLAHTAPMYVEAGDLDAAYSVAQKTLAIISRGPPAGCHLLFGYFATSDAFFSLWERYRGKPGERTIADGARRSVRVLERFARVFPVGRAEAERYEGRELLMSGKTERGLARLARAIETARAFDLPVEEARAHADLARLGPRVARERHRDLASALFTRAGTWGLLARMEAELDT